jgi:4a-hydroxytetrahydrobiopterin dehydratase
MSYRPERMRAMVELSRREISEAVSDLGWRFVLGAVRCTVQVASLAQAVEVAAACGVDDSLALDLRPDRVVLTLRSPETAWSGGHEIELARRITAALGELGFATVPDGAQVLELAIDALDIPSIRPFWKAALGYVDEPGSDGPTDPIVDPLWQRPAIWFQQTDAPRPQRNRIHFDLALPHDEAKARLEAALAAGGRLVSEARAPAFWVLADAEGNEICLTTWQGRD